MNTPAPRPLTAYRPYRNNASPLILNNLALEFAEKRHVSADGTRSGTLKTVDQAIADATPACIDQETLVHTECGTSEIRYIDPGIKGIRIKGGLKD